MNIELATDLLMREILAELEPEAQGAFIEIGLGTGNFSFSWAQKAGFKCYAVEPVPTLQLKQLAAARNIDLTEAAISNASGKTPIHLGVLNGVTIPDLSSLHADWWGGGKVTKVVSSLTLKEYLDSKKLNAISCLKVDTEGSEPSIFSSLSDIEKLRLPQLVVFEYGGGGSKESGLGGWRPNFYQGTLECLGILKRIGYGTLVVVEANARQERVVDLQSLANLEDLFASSAEVGNILCVRSGMSMERVRVLFRKIAPRLFVEDWLCKRAHWCSSAWWNYLERPTRGLMRRIRCLSKSTSR